MAHRQEEKEQRKRERLERERGAEPAAKRKRLLQIGGGVLVAAVVTIGVVLAVAGGSDKHRPTETAVKSAAKAAGCDYRTFPSEGRGHVTKTLTPADYKTN